MNPYIAVAVSSVALLLLGIIFYLVSGRSVDAEGLRGFVKLCILAADQVIPGATKADKRDWVGHKIQEAGLFAHLDIKLIDRIIDTVMDTIEGEDLADGTK